MFNATPLEDLLGKTLVSIVVNNDKTEMDLRASDGAEYRFHHEQWCCESVALEDIAGDLADILNSPILLAEAATNSDEPRPNEDIESFTWTFYKLATVKGRVTLRWLGESNGYYSEEVTFSQTKAPAASA